MHGYNTSSASAAGDCTKANGEISSSRRFAGGESALVMPVA